MTPAEKVETPSSWVMRNPSAPFDCMHNPCYCINAYPGAEQFSLFRGRTQIMNSIYIQVIIPLWYTGYR